MDRGSGIGLRGAGKSQASLPGGHGGSSRLPLHVSRCQPARWPAAAALLHVAGLVPQGSVTCTITSYPHRAAGAHPKVGYARVQSCAESVQTDGLWMKQALAVGGPLAAQTGVWRLLPPSCVALGQSCWAPGRTQRRLPRCCATLPACLARGLRAALGQAASP